MCVEKQNKIIVIMRKRKINPGNDDVKNPNSLNSIVIVLNIKRFY